MATTNLTSTPQESLVKTIKSAFNSRLLTLAYDNLKPQCLLPEIFLKEAGPLLQHEVESYLKINFAFKFNIVFYAIYAKPNLKNLENTALEMKTFQTDAKEVFGIKDYELLYAQNIDNIIRQTEEFHGKGGSWTIVQLIKLELNLYKYQALKGSSYIPLPEKIQSKRACINIQNNDIYCFKWCVIAAIGDVEIRACQPSAYKLKKIISSEIINYKGYSLNFTGLCFPLKINDISIFEENNPDISINVFGYKEDNFNIIGPYYKRKARKAKHINLLIIEEDGGEEPKSHYVWIKHLPRLLKSQTTSNPRKLYICDDCLKHFQEKDRFEDHIKNNCQTIVNIPKKDISILEFKNCDKTIDVPFVIYANSNYIYEILETRNSSQSYAFCYFIKCNFNETLDKLRCFKGPNAVAEFLKSLIKDVNYLYSNFLTKLKSVNQDLSEAENRNFLKNNKCHICCDKIKKEDKEKSHCHLTGKYLGPAHYFCIMNFKLLSFFPVIFHNLSAHDCELFVKEFIRIDNDTNNIIAQNKDSYITLAKTIKTDIGARIQIRFLDPSKFLPNKLGDLVKDMKTTDFKIIKSMFPNDQIKFNLLIRKGVFPYNYLNSRAKLSDTCLPSTDQFYNQLNEDECSLGDYKHAQDIWTTFKCKTLQDYLIMHMKTNVMLLTDVFENFRRICKTSYNLDPCHYYTAEELSWDAMLKITKTRFASLTDKTMITFLQKGLRGDVAVCSQRHTIANNKYLDDYNDQMPAKYLIHFEDNNLYDWAMSQVLPAGEFEWLTDIEHFSLDSLTADTNYGYILEVDLRYPQEIHDAHNSLPFCCEKKTVHDSKEKKLLVDLNHKSKYVIYYKNLQQCLKHGLKLEKIHRILKFKQTNWLSKYIISNSNGKNRFEKSIFKLLNNALYNKIMEKHYRDITVKFTDKWENGRRKGGARAHITKPEFRDVHIFEEDLVAIEVDNNCSYYKPIYLEFVILELIKWKMYNFHYDCLIPKYQKNVELNYMDANVFIYTITIDDFYKDVSFIKTLDFKINEKALLKEFIGLRSRMYSLKLMETLNGSTKGNCLTNLKCYFSNKTINYIPIYVLNSKLHNLYSELYKDNASIYLDNKRIIYYDNIHTLARGHYKDDDCVMSEI